MVIEVPSTVKHSYALPILSRSGKRENMILPSSVYCLHHATLTQKRLGAFAEVSTRKPCKKGSPPYLLIWYKAGWHERAVLSVVECGFISSCHILVSMLGSRSKRLSSTSSLQIILASSLIPKLTKNTRTMDNSSERESRMEACNKSINLRDFLGDQQVLNDLGDN